MTSKVIKIATRGSKLALWQANYIARLLKEKNVSSELNIIKTKGDRVQNRFLHEIGGKGLFVRELESSMLNKDTDIGVHSLKDLPAKTPKPFVLAAIMKRHEVADALIVGEELYNKICSKYGKDTRITKEIIAELGNISIATASLRRQSLLKGASKEVNVVPVRGNVDTRIQKRKDNNWDGLILAGASLERLEIDEPHFLFDTDWYTPSPAQGALALECLDDSFSRGIIETLSDKRTFHCASIERKVLELLGGDCTMPFGAHMYYDEDLSKTVATALVLNYEGEEVRASLELPEAPEQLDIEKTGKQLVAAFNQENLQKILSDLELKTPELGELNS